MRVFGILRSVAFAVGMMSPLCAWSQEKAWQTARPEAVATAMDVPLPLMEDTMKCDPVSIEPLEEERRVVGSCPLYGIGGAPAMWELHEGFNASFDMSVSASFGKHRFPGVGLFTGVSCMYAYPLTDRLVLSLGGSFGHFSWGQYSANRLGIDVMAGYQLTDKLGVYAYGTKVLPVSDCFRMCMNVWPYQEYFADRIGAMLEYKFNSKFSASISVEGLRKEH